MMFLYSHYLTRADTVYLHFRGQRYMRIERKQWFRTAIFHGCSDEILDVNR